MKPVFPGDRECGSDADAYHSCPLSDQANATAWSLASVTVTRAAVPCTVDAMVLADFKADDREWHDCKEEEALMVDHLTDSILMSLVEEQVGWLESMG